MTVFTAWDLVVTAHDDPSAIDPPSLDSASYIFEDQSGQGYFVVNGQVEPQGVEFTVAADNLATTYFYRLDPVDDYVYVQDTQPVYGFDYLILGPNSTPPNPEPPPPQAQSITLNVVLGTGGYGVITALQDDEPIPLNDGSNQAYIAFDDLMPIPAGSYAVSLYDSPTNGECLLFNNADFTDRNSIEIHIGNTPGDSAGCIVTGNTIVDGQATNNYWSNLISYIEANSSEPITVNVSGATAQPTLEVTPQYLTVAQGAKDSITFAVGGLQPSSPIVDKDIDVYFQIVGAVATSTLVTGATLLPNGSKSYLGDPLPNGCYEATIVGEGQKNNPPGSAQVTVTLNAAGLSASNLSIKIVHYDGVSEETNLSTFDYDPSGSNVAGSWGVQPMLENFVPVSIVVTTPTPVGTTADMIMNNPANGDYEIYDVGGNAVLAAYSLGQVGAPWAFVGLGTFQSGDIGDMLLRNGSSGAFEAYYISSNSITNAASVGVVGTNWSFSGTGDFDGGSGLSELLLRNAGSGSFELYHVAGGGELSGNSVAAVGNNFQVLGFGNFLGNGLTQMAMMDNSGDASQGQIEGYSYQSSTASFAGIDIGKIGSNLTVLGSADLLGNGTSQMVAQQNNGDLWLYTFNPKSNALSGTEVGAVGSNFHAVGFGQFGTAGQDEMLMQDAAGAFEVYQYNANLNAFVGSSMGTVGAPWVVDGIAANTASGTEAASTAQLTQAMAPIGSSTSVSTSSPLGSSELTEPGLLTTPQQT